MRRAVGYLFAILSAMALLLFVASISAWVYFGRMRVGFSVAPTAHSQFAMMAVQRVLVVRFSSVPFEIVPRAEIQRGNLGIGRITPDNSDVGGSILPPRASPTQVWEIASIAVMHRTVLYQSRGGRPDYSSRDVSVILPYWLIALLSLIAPAWWLVRMRHRRMRANRVASGQCLSCGYDLRAHQVGERCPECGAVQPLSASTNSTSAAAPASMRT